MKLLLDTCTFLWFISRDKKIPKKIVEIVQEPSHEVWVSALSFWECAIKEQFGWLKGDADLIPYLVRQSQGHQIDVLSLDAHAPRHLSKLPKIHKDPFDRMIICQAIENGLSIVTPDESIRQYPIKTIWC